MQEADQRLLLREELPKEIQKRVQNERILHCLQAVREE